MRKQKLILFRDHVAVVLADGTSKEGSEPPKQNDKFVNCESPEIEFDDKP